VALHLCLRVCFVSCPLHLFSSFLVCSHTTGGHDVRRCVCAPVVCVRRSL
jgi:hypothetical protein